MINFKKLLPGKVKFLIKKYFIKLKFYRGRESYKRLMLKSERKRLLLLGTPEYGNLGDHAIAYAEIMFIRQKFPDCELIEITQEHLKWDRKGVFKQILSDDVIIYTGGGFLGSMYLHTGGGIAREVLKTFYSNPIIIFPSTIFYELNDWGKRCEKEDNNIWCMCKNLSIFARDKFSGEFLKKTLPSNVKLYMVPDMALSLNYVKKEERSNVMIILRDDKECANEINRDILKSELLLLGLGVKFSSTRVEYDIFPEEREKELLNKLNEFTTTKLVITDRLHGVIFSIITGTPCIAIDNISHKISGVLSYINVPEYICMSNPESLLNDIKYMVNNKINNEYNYKLNKYQYRDIIICIRNELNY